MEGQKPSYTSQDLFRAIGLGIGHRPRRPQYYKRAVKWLLWAYLQNRRSSRSGMRQPSWKILSPGNFLSLNVDNPCHNIFYNTHKAPNPKKTFQKISENIARGTTDPGYRVLNLDYLFNYIECVSILDNTSFRLNCLDPLYNCATANLATGWRHLHWLQIEPYRIQLICSEALFKIITPVQ